MRRRVTIILVSVFAGALVCALAFFALREPATSGASLGPETDFLLSPLGELELGMSREALLELRRDAVVRDPSEPGEVSRLLFEEIESEEGRRRIIYFVYEQTLHQLIYMDTYPLEDLDRRIDRKLRTATERWGPPVSRFAESQLRAGEYLAVVWQIDPETVLTISYAPSAARTEGATREFPVITRYLPGSPADVQIPSIEPESFDLAAESAALDARIGSWEED